VRVHAPWRQRPGVQPGPDQEAPVPAEALLPLLVLAVAFVGYCLYDLSRSEVRHLPKWAWALLCVVSVPLGGIAYLVVGRQER
jgi:hypothetical protein